MALCVGYKGAREYTRHLEKLLNGIWVSNLMETKLAEYFEPLVEQLQQQGVLHSPSELHGVMCGLLSTGHGQKDAEVLAVLAAHVDTGKWQHTAAELWLKVRDLAVEAFTGEGLAFYLLLPDDTEELGVRVAALGQWCEGFLVGFGTGTAGTTESQLAPALQEAIRDIAAISQVDLPEDNSAEEEDLFAQVVEHTRMAALMVFTELALAARKDTPTTTPPTHH